MGSGEEAGSVLSDSQQAILTAVCDTVVPSLPHDRDADGLWARKASDLGVDAGAAQLISEISCAAPRSTPMSLAFRAQRPSGSRSRGSEGTTVSQTAVRTARWESLSTLPASSPEPIERGL